MNTIDDMQNEMNFLYHSDEFEHILDFEIFFRTTDDDTLGYDVLKNNVFLHKPF